MCTHMEVGRDSSVGIGARYGLDSPEIESGGRGGEEFYHRSRPVVGPTYPPAQRVPVSWPAENRRFLGVKEGVQKYFYPPLCPHGRS